MNETKDRIAIYALTEAGTQIAAKLADGFDQCKLFLPEKLQKLPLAIDKEISFYPSGGFSEMLAENWKQFTGHIFVMATGIVVRKIAPLLEHKTKDPAVVVCDEKGDYSISLLSGHIGGANRLANFAASILGGEAVITTATDVQGLMAFDELAAINGWKVVNPENIKVLNSMLLEGKQIALLIPEVIFMKYYSKKQNLSLIDSIDTLGNGCFDAVVILETPFNNLSLPVLSLKI
jgi:cobalt-precorrin 5A hydrolase/precorrin-3B C17-methyltransferase